MSAGPSTAATRSLQSQLDDAAEGEHLKLFLRETHEQIVIRKSLTLDGNGGTLFFENGPVILVDAGNVVLRNMSIQVAEDADYSTSQCAIEVRAGATLRLEKIKDIRGTVVGMQKEDGQWLYPYHISMGDLPAEREKTREFDIQVPIACRLRSDIAGVDVSPNNLVPGNNKVTIRVAPLPENSYRNGDVIVSTSSVDRRIRVSLHTLSSGPKPPSISEFKVRPSTIQVGQSATLNWDVQNATSVFLDPVIGSTNALRDSCAVHPTITTVYTLSARGPGGTISETVTLTVDVPPPPAPSIDRFTAQPAAIRPGQPVTLSWTSREAADAVIDPIPGLVPTNGSVKVSPLITTTYTLGVDGPGGTASAELTVRVKSVIKWKPILIVAVLIAVGVIWALMRIPSDPADLVLIRTLDAGGPVFTVGFSGDSRIVLAGSADNSVRVWNVSTGTPDIPVKRDDDPVHAVAFSPVSQILAFGQTTKVHLYLLEGSSWDYKNSLRNEGHSASVTSIAFSPDGKSIVTGGEDSKVLVWDVRSPESPAKTLTLTQHRGPVRSVAYSPDGRTVLSGGDDARLFLWDAQAGGVKWNSNQSGTIRAVAFSPRADLVASGGRDIELLDAVSGEVEGTLNDTDVMTVAFSPIGTILASGGKDGKVRLWDVRTKELKTTISAHDGGVLTVAFSPDRTVLATAGQDQKLKIWQRK